MMKTFFLCIMFNHILFIKHYDKIRIGPHRLLAMFSPSCERPWVASLWRGELSQDSQVRTNKLAKIRNQIRKKQIAKYLAAKNSLLNFGLCNFWDMSCHSHTMILKFEKSDANSQDCKIRSDWRDLIANYQFTKIWSPKMNRPNLIAKSRLPNSWTSGTVRLNVWRLALSQPLETPSLTMWETKR